MVVVGGPAEHERRSEVLGNNNNCWDVGGRLGMDSVSHHAWGGLEESIIYGVLSVSCYA